MTALSAPDRLLAVLAAFDHQHPALSLTGISRRSGLTLTTAHRLVGALTDWGALERDADGVYHVGLRLGDRGPSHRGGGGLPDRAAVPGGPGPKPRTRTCRWRSATAPRSSTSSGSPDAPRSVYASRSAPAGHCTRGRGPRTAAHGDSAFQEAYCSRPLAAFTPHTLTDGAACAARSPRSAAPAWR